jgi:hypothetical protein
VSGLALKVRMRRDPWTVDSPIAARAEADNPTVSSKTVKVPDVACARSGDPRGHQGLEGIGPQPIGAAGEVPLLEVCTCGMVRDR